jgi:hypothetical protein
METESKSKSFSLKHRLEVSDDPNPVKRLRIDSESIVENYKLQVFKNPKAQLNEIKAVQSLNYELISEEGPDDKKLFKYQLKFKLNDNKLVGFFGKGSSKKIAQKLAAMNGLYYLIKLPNSILNPFEINYIQAMLNYEVKSLNSDLNNIDEYFHQIENGPCELNDEQKEPKQAQSLIETDINNNEILKSNEIKNNKKTLELISNTKNSLIILNHLIPSDKKFEDVDDEQMNKNTNTNRIFKIKLLINKTALKNKEVEKYSNLEQSDTDFFFHGFGSSKKIAKSRAAQKAIESLFNIDIRPPEHNVIMDEQSRTTNHDTMKFKDFADNISELLKTKYDDLMRKIENNIIKTVNTKANDDLVNGNLDELCITNQNKFRNVYAGIVQTNEMDFNTAKLICLTTGTKCVSGQNMSLTGLSLNDWYV